MNTQIHKNVKIILGIEFILVLPKIYYNCIIFKIAPVCCTYLVPLKLSLWLIYHYPESMRKLTSLSKVPVTKGPVWAIWDTILKNPTLNIGSLQA